jgi:peptidoglycan/xylan/chitin deacetylase (PgdA/CDA1 family)
LYFGSVKFLKRVITIVILLIITASITSAAVFAVYLKKTIAENEKLAAALNTFQQAGKLDVLKDGKFTAEQLAEVLKSANVEDKDLLKAIYEKDPDKFEQVLSELGYSSPGSVNAVSSEGVENTQPPAPAHEYEKLYPDLYAMNTPPAEYNKDENHIYLTFDDGPSDNTDGILEYLKQNNVRATFFVIPSDTESCARRLNKILESGNILGVHTFSHDYNKIYKSVDAFLEDFDKAYELIYKQTGYRPFLFRFPGGSVNDYNTDTRKDIIAEMNRRGFVYYDWNVDSEDAMGANWTKIMNNVETEIKNVPRAIILFHDGAGRKNTVLVIDDVIKKLKNDPKGYVFDVITEKTRPMQF